jgi:hypothetical protein
MIELCFFKQFRLVLWDGADFYENIKVVTKGKTKFCLVATSMQEFALQWNHRSTISAEMVELQI